MAFPLYPLVGTGQQSTPVLSTQSALFSAIGQSHMTFTPSVTSNNKTMTFAAWVRRGNTALNITPVVVQPLIQANNSSTFIGFDSAAQNGDCLYILTPGGGQYEPIDVLRDTTGWFHVCVCIDTTQAVASDRIKTWINGVPSSSGTFFSIYPALNTSLDFNTSGVVNEMGGNSGASTYFDGYMADVYMLDGIAATPSLFTTGTGSECRPISYNGGVGTNGYHLPMTNGADLGEDTSAQGNDWTLVNMSSTNQSNNGIGDTCNLTCIYNTEVPFQTFSFTRALQNAGIHNFRTATAHFSVASGKWYWEVGNTNTTSKSVGITWDGYSYVNHPGSGSSENLGGSDFPLSWAFQNDGSVKNNGSSSAYGSSWGAGDTIGVALDMDSSKVFFSINGIWQGGGDPVAGTNPAFTFTSGLPMVPGIYGATNADTGMAPNFGSFSSGFSATPPAGYESMIASNLPDPVIATPKSYAAPFTYTGTGSALNITGLGFQPDLVFTRLRSGSTGTPIAMYDSIRGPGAYLDTSTTNGQSVDAQSLTAFTANGFTVGTSTASNASGGNYMGFALKSNPANGFVAFQYVGDGTTDRNIAHTLGVSPDLIWVKRVDTSGAWYGYFSAFPTQLSYYQPNNSALAVGASNSPWGAGGFNSATFSVSGNGINNLNENTATYVVYMWANTTGLFNIGSYAGNNAAALEGRLVFNRLRPSWVYTVGGSGAMTDTIYDVARNPFNPVNYAAYFSSSADELTTGCNADIYSMGFNLRHAGARSNQAATYYYLAIGDAPYNSTTAR